MELNVDNKVKLGAVRVKLGCCGEDLLRCLQAVKSTYVIIQSGLCLWDGNGFRYDYNNKRETRTINMQPCLNIVKTKQIWKIKTIYLAVLGKGVFMFNLV